MTITPEHANLLARIQPCDFLQLDMTALGNQVARLPLISLQMGHSAVGLTVADYLAPHPPATREAEFARDLFLDDPQCIAERWFGSTANAIAFTRVMLGSAG